MGVNQKRRYFFKGLVNQGFQKVIMNINTYKFHYGNFHRCAVSTLQNNMIVFDLGHAPYETWSISRMETPSDIIMNCEKPFVDALKCYFKGDPIASVVSNEKYIWTICLGKDKMIFPVNRDNDSKDKNILRLYATTHFVKNPNIIKEYLQNGNCTAHENIYYHEDVILYLDNQDLPFPGGYYFDESEPTPFYRICFLTHLPMDRVSKLATQWQSRRDVETIPCMTRTVIAHPKFIDFHTVPEFNFSESSILSNGIIQRKLSSKKPEFVIQDILLSYYQNFSQHELNINHLGLILEWPIMVSYEGSWTTQTSIDNRKVVALSINGNLPNRVLYVMNPHDRFVEYSDVPATLWTPVYFVSVHLKLPLHYRKVVLDTIVIGIIYNEIFFCLNKPLLEGRPYKPPIQNSEYLLSVASTESLKGDMNIRVIETFKHNNQYSLHRVSLKGIPYETWCLTNVEDTHPFPKNYPLPNLVQQWLEFVKTVQPHDLDVDVNMVRLALTLAQQKVCYNLELVKNEPPTIHLSNDKVKINLPEGPIKFINDIRLENLNTVKDSRICIIS